MRIHVKEEINKMAMAAKRVIEVNESSIVDLKAELSRKESQFKKARLGVAEVKVNRQPKKPPVWAKPKKESTTSTSKTISEINNLSSEEQQALQKSRQALEAKSILYEKMARGEIEDEGDDEEGGRFLVDFHKKVYSKENEDHVNSEEELINDDIPPPQGPDEEWVDYVDSLGRNRRCLRKDLQHVQQMDKNISARKSPPTLLSEDMRRELVRQKWEQEEEELANRPVGPVHYQNIRFDEIRNHGVGYYQFSTSEEERQEQMKTLDKLREQTMEQRARAQKLKEKRKAVLDARLAKVRERKLKKMGQASEALDGSEPGEEKETNESTGVAESTTEERVKERSSDREEKDEKFQSRLPEKKAQIPEWAAHKIKLPDKQRPPPGSDTRSERIAEFAPPTFYYEENRGKQDKKQNRQEVPKLFKQNPRNSTVGDESTDETLNAHQQNYTNQQQEQQQSQPLPPPPLSNPSHPDGLPPLPLPPQEHVRAPWVGHQWYPNMPPPFPPPQQSSWQPYPPPWQFYQAPPLMGTGPCYFYPHANWDGNLPGLRPSLPATFEHNQHRLMSTENSHNRSTTGNSVTTSTKCKLEKYEKHHL